MNHFATPGFWHCYRQLPLTNCPSRCVTPDDERPEDDLQPEYDFRSLRGVVRGKYAERYRERLRVVRLAPDVAEAFDDEAAANDALREYLHERREHKSSNSA